MKKAWWKEAVVYQIYPRSFYDSDGDGIGDLKGINLKLDYLKDLGIDVIWLSPVYKSPNDDNGYDISDYRDIMEEFGTLKDFEELLAEAHNRGIKLIMDLVVNHTSDEHPWFVEARASKDSPKRDYYIWREGRNGKEPNNWGSFFCPSAWTYDEATGEYYLHLFSGKQPDLNWANPDVREEVYDMMTWWLDKGIDGFRMDVINCICKPVGLADSCKAPTCSDGYVLVPSLYANCPGVHQYLQEMNRKVLSRYDIMTVGETSNVTPETAALYVGEGRKELNMVFQFELMGVDCGEGGKWDRVAWKLTEFKGIMSRWQKELSGKGWNSLYLGNHDQPRQVSRFGDDGKYRMESAKMLATLLHTLQGTPYIYQGEEIGMTNVWFESLEECRDIETLNFYREYVAGRGGDPEKAMELIHAVGRDNARTPMQWDNSANAGFTAGKPWIKVNPNYVNINARNAVEDKNSIFNYYKRLIELRKEIPVLVYGEYRPVLEEDEQIYSYLRCMGEERLLVVLNFFGTETLFSLPAEITCEGKELLISNYAVPGERDLRNILLRPYEARVYRLM